MKPSQVFQLLSIRLNWTCPKQINQPKRFFSQLPAAGAAVASALAPPHPKVAVSREEALKSLQRGQVMTLVLVFLGGGVWVYKIEWHLPKQPETKNKLLLLLVRSETHACNNTRHVQCQVALRWVASSLGAWAELGVWSIEKYQSLAGLEERIHQDVSLGFYVQ